MAAHAPSSVGTRTPDPERCIANLVVVDSPVPCEVSDTFYTYADQNSVLLELRDNFERNTAKDTLPVDDELSGRVGEAVTVE